MSKIELNVGKTKIGDVTLDGAKIKNIDRIIIDAQVGKPTKITITTTAGKK